MVGTACARHAVLTMTEQTPPSPAPPPARKLYRTRDDRVISGVCGGLARYFNVDPVIVRVAAVALIFVGAAGLFLYLAAILLVPTEVEGGEPASAPSRALAITGIVILVIAIGSLVPFRDGWWDPWSLVPLGFVAVVGLLVWRVASGQRPEANPREILRAIGLGLALLALCLVIAVSAAWAAAAGGNEVVAGLVVAAGLALIAGAFLDGRARWLILPALAVALPAGAVAAADLDITGGHGDRTYRPASSEQVRDSYRLGAGQLVVDLRGAHLTPGEHRLKLRLGLGEAQLVVPRGVCVSSDSHIGVGGVELFDRDRGGIDVDWVDQQTAPATTPHVIVDASVTIGAFTVHHDEDQGFDGDRGNGACA